VRYEWQQLKLTQRIATARTLLGEWVQQKQQYNSSGASGNNSNRSGELHLLEFFSASGHNNNKYTSKSLLGEWVLFGQQLESTRRVLFKLRVDRELCEFY
jgi:hypothetical protein